MGTTWAKVYRGGKHGLPLKSSSQLENISNMENKGGKVDWSHIEQGLTCKIFGIKHWYKCWENFGEA